MKSGPSWLLLGTLVPLTTMACVMPFQMVQVRPMSGSCPEAVVPRESPADTTVLRWYRVEDERDVRMGSAWCGTVGPPAIRLEPTEGFAPWSDSGSVTVATWNMHIGGGDLYGFLTGELGLDCTAGRDVAREGVQPFVLLLQEVWRHTPGLPIVDDEFVPRTIDPKPRGGEDPNIVDAAERCGLALVYVPSARNGPDSGSRPSEDKGNAVLSSLPLTTPIALELPFEAGRKVAVAATAIAPGGQRVRFVSTHLDVASTLVRTLFSGNQTRARQVRALIDGIDEAERDGPVTNVVVVGGDFNTWAGNESALGYMEEAFPESPAWDGQSTRRRLSFPTDHIYFRRASFSMFGMEGYRRIEDSYGSDHFGRRAILTFTPFTGGH